MGEGQEEDRRHIAELVLTSMEVILYGRLQKYHKYKSYAPLPLLGTVYCHTANEGPVRHQYKSLVSHLCIPRMKLCNLLISKTEI
jgi:hypothetical protein